MQEQNRKQKLGEFQQTLGCHLFSVLRVRRGDERNGTQIDTLHGIWAQFSSLWDGPDPYTNVDVVVGQI